MNKETNESNIELFYNHSEMGVEYEVTFNYLTGFYKVKNESVKVHQIGRIENYKIDTLDLYSDVTRNH